MTFKGSPLRFVANYPTKLVKRHIRSYQIYGLEPTSIILPPPGLGFNHPSVEFRCGNDVGWGRVVVVAVAVGLVVVLVQLRS